MKAVKERLDDIDLRIINLLQEDSRLSYNKIASKLGISVGTAYNRIKSLEEKGILKGYTVLIDMDKLGYDLTALILIQAEGKHLLDVETEIAKMNNVVSVYDITGDFDIAVIARFEDRNSLNQFIKSLISLPHVKRTVTNVVLNVVKEDIRIKIVQNSKI
ncbi:MAG: Lrp/AsnC family transcriptional regulator [Candidatus Bathyarchaeota archaeon]|nr:Lrp/AsnC family transcriptional regulator [Candidatus Bathyarchaeota archaeon]